MEHISEPSSIADQSDMSSRWEKGLLSPLTVTGSVIVR